MHSANFPFAKTIDIGIKACAGGKSVLFKNAVSLSTELTETKDKYALGSSSRVFYYKKILRLGLTQLSVNPG